MFDGSASRKIQPLLVDVVSTVEFIKSVQKNNGEIPWSPGGKTDPWDHVESAMGLTVGGCTKEAKNAYLWSYDTQLKDGSWWAYYKNGKPEDNTYKDTNMTSYIAVGVYHYYLTTGDKKFLFEIWPCIEKAVEYTINKQGTEGQMYWAETKDGKTDKRALLTGSSSIYLSLNCAIKMAGILGYKKSDWEASRMWLGKAIHCKSHLFDNSKSNFSMDWYYPILCGIITGQKAEKRLQKYWDIFAVKDWGIKCVSDRPWVTMAETAELVMTLVALGKITEAEIVFSWIQDKKYENGAYWMGVTYPDWVIYTDEQTAWTGAAVLLAADMIYCLTPGHMLFKHGFLKPHRFMYSLKN